MPAINEIKLRRGTGGQWSELNPILSEGEPGFDTTNKVFKIGDGVSPWSSLGMISGNDSLSSQIYNVSQPQSIFTVTDGYIVGSLHVFYNGVKLIENTDFTATNGTTFTLTTPASAGSVVECMNISTRKFTGVQGVQGIQGIGSAGAQGTQGIQGIDGSILQISTSSQWSQSNQILSQGQPGFDITSRLLKIGDGISSWTQLDAVNSNYRANRGVIEVSSNQSVFNVAGGYVVGALDVFVNGVKLVNNLDFIATNGYTFTVNSTVPAGAVVEYIGLASLNGSGISTDQYSASISRDIINVTTNNLNSITVTGGYDIGGIDVYKNGIKLTRGIDFTANDGSTIAFTQTPQQGSVIEYVSFISGKARRSISTISSSTNAGSIAQTDYIYVATSPLTVTLPNAIGNNNRYTVKNIGIGSVIVVPQNGQTIDGQSSVVITRQYTSIDLVGNGQNWIII